MLDRVLKMLKIRTANGLDHETGDDYRVKRGAIDRELRRMCESNAQQAAAVDRLQRLVRVAQNAGGNDGSLRSVG